MFGRKARLPIDTVYGTAQPDNLPVDCFVNDMSVVLENTYQHIRNTMGLKQDHQKELYDRRILSGRKFSMASFFCCPSWSISKVSSTLDRTI